ncbi:hypothetical protein AUR64_13495 [Haloprofundus marisrubri]|uniref:Uncharacterized protein n=1 Tax=Haloprofundus marisrubri TaxID=1514971 RepID=A0A0W1R6I1_9EURY|nr:hypothetical protein [Haloprofundus marisrubri]KTG08828.1 hypothetical protein AUR64_13495 [Haloprofundus marisrubri]
MIRAIDRRLAVLAAAVGTLAVAVGTVFVPVSLGASLATFSRVFVVLLAGLSGLFAVVVLTGIGEDRAHWTPERDPEQAYDGARESAGGQFDDALSELEDESGWKRQREKTAIRRSLHDAAIVTIAARGDCKRLEAARRIEDGTWTTNVRAASFLGGEEAPSLPLRTRVRDWAAGRRFERAAEETVEELSAYEGGEPGDEKTVDDWPELAAFEALADDGAKTAAEGNGADPDDETAVAVRGERA